MILAAFQRFGAVLRRHAKPHRVGHILGAGAQTPLLMAAQVGRAQRLALVVTEEQRADALGRVDLVAGQREGVHPFPLFQVDGHTQPCLHRVHMEMGAAVFLFDARRQCGNILHRAGLVVHRHAGGQHGAFVHRREKFFRGKGAVPLRQDFHHVEPEVPQRPDGPLHAGMLKPGYHDFIAPVPPGQRRAPHRHVVALRPAGGEIHFVTAAVQRFGHAGAGGLQRKLAFHRRVVQTAGIGPAGQHRLMDDVRHRGVHHGGGGII